MKFSELIGQQVNVNRLVQIIQEGRLSHAILLKGHEGNGALALALCLSQYLVCESRIKNPLIQEACGECPGCIKASQNIHPDIHFSYPIIIDREKKKFKSIDFIDLWRKFLSQKIYGNVLDWLNYLNPENKQGNISAEECDEIIHALSLKGYESPFKIMLLWMPEYLGKEGNKLLKIIEEPPIGTFLFLITEKEKNILPTIVSRCTPYSIPRPSDDEIKQYVINQGESPDSEMQQLASEVNGNLRELFYRKEIFSERESYFILIEKIINSAFLLGPVAHNECIEEIYTLGREKQKYLLVCFLSLIEKMIDLQITQTTKIRENLSVEFSLIQKMLSFADISIWLNFIPLFEKNIYFIERNANAKTLFHSLIIRLYYAVKKHIILEP